MEAESVSKAQVHKGVVPPQIPDPVPTASYRWRDTPWPWAMGVVLITPMLSLAGLEPDRALIQGFAVLLLLLQWGARAVAPAICVIAVMSLGLFPSSTTQLVVSVSMLLSGILVFRFALNPAVHLRYLWHAPIGWRDYGLIAALVLIRVGLWSHDLRVVYAGTMSLFLIAPIITMLVLRDKTRFLFVLAIGAFFLDQVALSIGLSDDIYSYNIGDGLRVTLTITLAMLLVHVRGWDQTPLRITLLVVAIFVVVGQVFGFGNSNLLDLVPLGGLDLIALSYGSVTYFSVFYPFLFIAPVVYLIYAVQSKLSPDPIGQFYVIVGVFAVMAGIYLGILGQGQNAENAGISDSASTIRFDFTYLVLFLVVFVPVWENRWFGSAHGVTLGMLIGIVVLIVWLGILLAVWLGGLVPGQLFFMELQGAFQTESVGVASTVFLILMIAAVVPLTWLALVRILKFRTPIPEVYRLRNIWNTERNDVPDLTTMNARMHSLTVWVRQPPARPVDTLTEVLFGKQVARAALILAAGFFLVGTAYAVLEWRETFQERSTANNVSAVPVIEPDPKTVPGETGGGSSGF